MKNLFKIIGIIAIVAVIGLSMTACPVPEPEEEELSGTITISPTGSVDIGTKLTATYSGSESVSFQWKKDGNNVGSASTTNPNEYTPTEAGSYTVTVSAEGYKSKTSAAVTVGGGSTELPNAISLTEGVWADGNIPTVNDVQWFTFVATDNTQNIFFEPGTMSIASLQLYGSNAVIKNGKEQTLIGSVIVSQTTFNEINYTSGNRYYIKMFGNSNFSDTYPDKISGTFKIAFGKNTPPAITLPTENVTELTANTWTAGDISSALSEQWYKFTANANPQYIHFELGTMTMAFVKLYDNTGKIVGDSATIMSTILNISRTVTSGSEYYVRVTAIAAGTYKIGYTNSTTPPPIELPEYATDLPANTFTEGFISEGGENWFKFNATDNTQYIHFKKNNLSSVYVQLYNNTGTAVGVPTRLSDSTLYTSKTVTSGQDYYIKVYPTVSTQFGEYVIAVSDSFTTPGTTLISLTENVWAEGSIADVNGEQWVKFTASAATQYIFAKSGPITPTIQLYDATGNTIGDRTIFWSSTPYASVTVTSGLVYYIKVGAASAFGDGGPYSYQITFSSSNTAPLPVAVQLTENKWVDGYITQTGEQWFKFTAPASTYLHFIRGMSWPLVIQLYDNTGAAIGEAISVSYGTNYTSLEVTSGNDYYIRLKCYSEGPFEIGFTSSTTPPSGIVIPTDDATNLAVVTWADGNIATAGGVQWFKFTASANPQYILFDPGTVTDLDIQLYDNTGVKSGDVISLGGSAVDSIKSLAVTSGSTYYIKAKPSTGIGTYKITINTTYTFPAITTPTASVTTLEANTWADCDSSTGVRWFKFKATAANQYIHSLITVNGLSVFIQLCDTSGNKVGLYESPAYNSPSMQEVTIGQDYYMKVIPVIYFGNNPLYKIAFSSTQSAPAAE